MENHDQPKRSENAERIKQALTNARPFLDYIRRRGPTLEVRAYLDTLDAMGIHIVLYLVEELRVPITSIPRLLPMIDRRWFEDHFESEIAAILKKIEEDKPDPST